MRPRRRRWNFTHVAAVTSHVGPTVVKTVTFASRRTSHLHMSAGITTLKVAGTLPASIHCWYSPAEEKGGPVGSMIELVGGSSAVDTPGANVPDSDASPMFFSVS